MDPHGVVGRCGRRVVLMGTIVSQAVFGCAIAFAPDIYSFLVLRFAIALVITGVFQVAFVLGIILVLLHLVDKKLYNASYYEFLPIEMCVFCLIVHAY